MQFTVDQALTMTEKYGTYECRKYREHIFSAHEFLTYELASRYVEVAESQGYVEANRVLGKLHKILTLGKHFQGLYIDSPIEQVKQFAKCRSLQILAIFEGCKKRYEAGYALKRVIKILDDCDLKLPLKDPANATEEQIASAMARCCDPAWWRRQILNRQSQMLEFVHIILGKVNIREGIYASDSCVKRKLSQWERNRQLLAGLEAENELGQVFTLLELAERGVSNLVNRRNELMTRMRGFEEYAKEQGDVAVFYTLTAPSKYHSFWSKPCIPNPKFKDLNPSETQHYFNKVFSRIRAQLARLGIQPYGFRVVEPHHDGTPHWHILFFMKPHQVQQVNKTIKHYCLEEDGDEKGAQEHRVKIELIDPAKGSATGYIAKYIAKNIDGQDVGEDNYGFDAITSAVRIRAWASTWNIRQFQQIGGPSVTAWREARRFASQDNAADILATIGSEKLEALIAAINEGDWKGYIEQSGGATAPRKEQPLRAFHVLKESLNKYGETANKILGIIFGDVVELVTRIHVWTVRPKALSQETSSYEFCSSIRGANAHPWSSVNNCTALIYGK